MDLELLLKTGYAVVLEDRRTRTPLGVMILQTPKIHLRPREHARLYANIFPIAAGHIAIDLKSKDEDITVSGHKILHVPDPDGIVPPNYYYCCVVAHNINKEYPGSQPAREPQNT